jgi:beta-1,4-mannosyl-glycoprotein beta-1,4-N-acetylglucosaminyltransferase
MNTQQIASQAIFQVTDYGVFSTLLRRIKTGPTSLPKIYDCFTYYNEDLLLRLETLNEVVDRFVIAEATHTHTGKSKPLFFKPERYAKFSSKIIHVIVDDMPLHLGNPLANEIYQRNALLRGLSEASSDDWVIVSDVDEIPNPVTIRRYRPWYLYGTLVQRFYSYFLNNLAVRTSDLKTPRWWIRAKITTAGHLKSFFRTPENLRIYKPDRGISGLIKHLERKVRHQRLSEGGWHFSWLMTPEQMIEKIESYSHTEHNTPSIKSLDAIRAAIESGRDILRKGERFRLVEIDSSFPPFLREHLDQFHDWCLDPTKQAR